MNIYGSIDWQETYLVTSSLGALATLAAAAFSAWSARSSAVTARAAERARYDLSSPYLSLTIVEATIYHALKINDQDAFLGKHLAFATAFEDREDHFFERRIPVFKLSNYGSGVCTNLSVSMRLAEIPIIEDLPRELLQIDTRQMFLTMEEIAGEIKFNSHGLDEESVKLSFLNNVFEIDTARYVRKELYSDEFTYAVKPIPPGSSGELYLPRLLQCRILAFAIHSQNLESIYNGRDLSAKFRIQIRIVYDSVFETDLQFSKEIVGTLRMYGDSRNKAISYDVELSDQENGNHGGASIQGIATIADVPISGYSSERK